MPNKPHAPRGGQNKKSVPPTASGSSSKDVKSGGKNTAAKGQSNTVKSEDGKKGGSKQASKSTAEAPEEAPKKPDTRTLIGGASWTGKLPVNLIAELCQKQKWNKPEYTMTRIPSGFISSVILSFKNPKSGEITTLPAFAFPKSRQNEIAEPTALEARHFAAAYALYRVTSMKNTHMMMPPKYKDLWKGLFTSIKTEDVKHGNAWMYEADPFLTALQREEAVKAELKKREEDERIKAKQAANPTISLGGGKSKAWELAPSVDMGKRVRFDVEDLIRRLTIWNPSGISMSSADKSNVINNVVKLGFRPSHVQEAADICKDKEEILEWLLTHIPEDDLPPWSLPENYVAGISMASSDLKKEAVIKRLAAGGYSRDLCEELLDDNTGNETQAAAALQAQLLQQHLADGLQTVEIDEAIDDVWQDEQAVLQSIFGDRYVKFANSSCKIALDTTHGASALSVKISQPIRAYPHHLPIISIEGSIPAYIRLSITKQALQYALQSLLREQMIFNLVDWLEQNIDNIMANPGRLNEISSVAAAGESRAATQKHNKSRRQVPQTINWKSNNLKSIEILKAWEVRQNSSEFTAVLKVRQSLPAWSAEHDIIQAINENKVSIISGETGSGKSTQAVQFILDHMIQKGLGQAANIICTQPRRISALGLADRVAEERCGTVGNEVGYIIRGDSKVKHGTTKLTFMTTGVLLRKLQTSGGSRNDLAAGLADVSHIFIDEVHERAVDADFLLVLLKDVLKTRQDLKLVLMSATVDAEGFERYFSDLGSVGRVHIKGRTFPVRDIYKDDIIRMTGHNMSQDWDDREEEQEHKAVSNALRASGMKIDYELITKTVELIDNELGFEDGSILIFLPGAMEIDQIVHALRHNPALYPLPLHASLPPSEQRRVFPPAPKGKRKVIAATNVAETSITIPDIVAVIDTGRVKETTFDPSTSTRRLVEVWASRAACSQRRGRAGRVREGVCYKLFTRNTEAKMRERPDPEILRVPLEQLCLTVKSMGVQDVAAFLASALTPPSSHAVDSALSILTRVGAMEDNELTALGKHLAMIPADLKCAKLLVLGSIFDCVDACLSISALITSKSIFFNPRDKREEVKKVRFDFAPGQGDMLSDLRAYEEWLENKLKYSNRDLRKLCDEKFLNIQALRDVDSNRAQFASSLQEIGFLPLSYHAAKASISTGQNSNDALLRALITASFHPNILTITFPATKFAASHTGALALDPEVRTIKFFGADKSRVFIHPSSTCFDTKGWSSDVKFLSYWEQFASGEGDRAKTYARGVTPTNTLSVLLFGGPLALDTLGRGVLVDDWIKVRGWARIGVLAARMRRLLDSLLESRIDEPHRPLLEHEVKILDVTRRLVERDGMDR